MKKLLIILFMGTMLAACGDSAKSRTSDVNEDQNVEENSGEVVSPQIESDSLRGMDVDSLSSPVPQDSIR